MQAGYHNATRRAENERFTLPVITGSQHIINDMFPISLRSYQDQNLTNFTMQFERDVS